ncbi:unnamed protein product [Caenorhabditis auriculariae]|uniref:Uncharacterized protein n=1 Tax=Caenorhabditis auriculariae TaxID=2777116 RepID=A0A8S1HN14_9PELO|nr:unnamed protein product [Caenorhabditis auriculariae]
MHGLRENPTASQKNGLMMLEDEEIGRPRTIIVIETDTVLVGLSTPPFSLPGNFCVLLPISCSPLRNIVSSALESALIQNAVTRTSPNDVIARDDVNTTSFPAPKTHATPRRPFLRRECQYPGRS